MYVALLSYTVVSTAAFCTAGGALLRQRQRCRRLVGDLTAALEQKRASERALLDQCALDAKKDEFISIVSHELRTPLTSIHGALGLVSAGAVGSVDPAAQNLLRIASSNTERLVRLINDLLDLQRMDSGQVPPQLTPCSLADVVVHSTDTMGSMAEGAGVRLEIVPAPEAILFAGDSDRMQQVLCNLLSNAIKFSPRGGVVRIHAEVQGTELLLCVRDHGDGVPESKLEAMFERFAQVDPSASRRKGGTGLGLAICRAIVAQHGGWLWARRNDTEHSGSPGITLYLRLPRLQDFTQTLPAADRTASGPTVTIEPGVVRRNIGESLGRGDYAVNS